MLLAEGKQLKSNTASKGSENSEVTIEEDYRWLYPA